MKKFLASTAVLSLPALALATGTTATTLINALLGNLPAFIGPIVFFFFFPWLILLGIGAWFLFKGRGN